MYYVYLLRASLYVFILVLHKDVLLHWIEMLGLSNCDIRQGQNFSVLNETKQFETDMKTNFLGKKTISFGLQDFI
jgi:hypothetical protein